MRGRHPIKHWSVTQPTIALSSGEAELGGICRGASISLGLQSLARDLGIELKLNLHTDATAAIGICRRRGLGKVRHLAVADLWVQDKVRAGDFRLMKVATSGCWPPKARQRSPSKSSGRVRWMTKHFAAKSGIASPA